MAGISGKSVLISGASSGIGRAAAKTLAAAGASVMLAARREGRLQDLKADIQRAGGIAAYRVLDVTDRRQFHETAQACIKRFGKLDALLNNAGIMPLSYMRKLHVEEWENMIDVNVKGVLNGIAAVLGHFIERDEGHIINVSSVAGHVVFPGSAVYSGSKFAVRAITEGLRMELHPDTRIRVTLISPGAVSTELAATITDTDVLEGWKQTPVTPMPPENIAAAVLYAMEQPKEVDVSEIVVRPVSQRL